MAVTQTTFEEFSLEEYRRKYLGARLHSLSFDWREFLRSSIYGLPLSFVFLPFFWTYLEYRVCVDSVRQIEKAELRQLEKIKKEHLARTLLDNPHFNV